MNKKIGSKICLFALSFFFVFILYMTSGAYAYTIPSHYSFFLPGDVRFEPDFMVKPGETFSVTMRGSGGPGGNLGGGFHVHWDSSQAEYVSGTSSSGANIYNGTQGNYGVFECDGPYTVYCTLTLRALANWGQSIRLYYRTWNWVKDIDCGSGTYDYLRTPQEGICSPNCDQFPEDLTTCDTTSVDVLVQGCIRRDSLGLGFGVYGNSMPGGSIARKRFPAGRQYVRTL